MPFTGQHVQAYRAAGSASPWIFGAAMVRRGLGTPPSDSGAGSRPIKDPTGTAVVWTFLPLPGPTAQDSPSSCGAACYCPGRKELKEDPFFSLTKCNVFPLPNALEIVICLINLGTFIPVL